MKHISFLFFVFVLSSLTYSGPVFEEYKKVEKEKRLRKNTPAKQKAQLKKTLLISLKAAMLKFFDYPDYDEISENDFIYELVKGDTFTYYVKYKTFLGYFIYVNDPSQYFLTPIEVRFISKPGTKLVRRENIIEEGVEERKMPAKTSQNLPATEDSPQTKQ